MSARLGDCLCCRCAWSSLLLLLARVACLYRWHWTRVATDLKTWSSCKKCWHCWPPPRSPHICPDYPQGCGVTQELPQQGRHSDRLSESDMCEVWFARRLRTHWRLPTCPGVVAGHNVKGVASHFVLLPSQHVVVHLIWSVPSVRPSHVSVLKYFETFVFRISRNQVDIWQLRVDELIGLFTKLSDYNIEVKPGINPEVRHPCHPFIGPIIDLATTSNPSEYTHTEHTYMEHIYDIFEQVCPCMSHMSYKCILVCEWISSLWNICDIYVSAYMSALILAHISHMLTYWTTWMLLLLCHMCDIYVTVMHASYMWRISNI